MPVLDKAEHSRKTADALIYIWHSCSLVSVSERPYQFNLVV